MKIPNFVRNLSHDAEVGLLQPVLSRDEEIEDILRIISSPEKPSCVLLGPPGSGKSALVEGLAYKLHIENKLPLKIFLVDLAAMNSGTPYRGDIEKRAMELKEFATDKNVVLFIDEFHMLAGLGRAGDSGASSDVSQILKPELAKGTIRCIGATTEGEFNTYIRPDTAMVRRFQLVRLRSLEGGQLDKVVRAKLSNSESRLLIRFTPDAVDRIIHTAKALFPSRAEPDRSLDILRLITQKYNNRVDLRSTPKHNLKEAFEMLDKQRNQLTINDIDSATSVAKEWLGLGLLDTRTITSQELEQQLSEIANKLQG